MKKALLIGAAGFVGNHLINAIAETKDWEIFATKLPQERITNEKAEIWNLDILKPEDTDRIFREIQPDYVFHLAAQSSVAASWKNPDLTIDVNIKGSVHVLEAARKLEKQPRILLIGSGEEYGYVKSCEIPIAEENAVRPGNLYAATKACQNMIGSIYARAYRMDVIMVRAFNHIGPGQADMFVVSDFCRQAAECEAGKREAKLKTGNLQAKRDFTDVRDVVRAYLLLMEKGRAGECYNIGSGNAVAIRELLDRILSMTNTPIEIETDSARLRPSDIPVIQADIGKLQAATGWVPQIPLERTIKETLDYWRNNI